MHVGAGSGGVPFGDLPMSEFRNASVDGKICSERMHLHCPSSCESLLAAADALSQGSPKVGSQPGSVRAPEKWSEKFFPGATLCQGPVGSQKSYFPTTPTKGRGDEF